MPVEVEQLGATISVTPGETIVSSSTVVQTVEVGNEETVTVTDAIVQATEVEQETVVVQDVLRTETVEVGLTGPQGPQGAQGDPGVGVDDFHDADLLANRPASADPGSLFLATDTGDFYVFR